MSKEEKSEKKIRSGELRVAVEEEKAIWCDRKRKTIFALPWSFTKYTLTASRLFIQTGFFNRNEEEIRLYRMTDISYTQSFWERIAGTGTLKLLSSDTSCPTVELKHIKNAKKVKDVISQCIEVARKENGVRTSEVVGAHYMGDGHDHHHQGSLGPSIVPDLNHNGIDDRVENLAPETAQE